MVRRGAIGRLGAAALVAWGLAAPVAAQKFLPDDPIWRDPDDVSIPQPGEIELSNVYDMLENTLGWGTPPRDDVPRAANVNTLGEVPDSSWFVNRIGRRPMSLDELVRGPDTTGGPDTSAPWTIIRGKSGGITPGFTVHDDRGDVYFVKFDPSDHPNLASGADVIGTKLFHAIGYPVPENYIAFIARDALRIAPHATISGGGRDKAKMTEADLDAILANVRRRPDGRMRVVASLNLPGRPLGPRKFFGTRGDDPNDIFPHEDRRELRGLRVFSAWLNHDDSRSINSLDMYVTEGGRSYVRHYLIDFASILGSGSVRPQGRRAGNEYLLDWGAFFKAAVTLGIWDRAWRDVEYPDYPEIGRFEADFYQPHRWVPEYPNPAFQRTLDDDAFWAAHIVEQFSDEALRAVVATAQYDDPEAARYLVDTLIRRRDKTVDHYYRQLNPIHELRVEPGSAGPELRFAHLGERRGLGRVEAHEFAWFRFDNDSETREPIGAPGATSDTRLPIPGSDAAFLVVRLRTRADVAEWGNFVDVYLRNTDPPSVVGIEREN